MLGSTLSKFRTFLNCHKLFLNTVSISLRAKIEPAHDLHIDIARFVLVGFVERGATCYWHSFRLPCLLLEHPLCGLNENRPLAHLMKTCNELILGNHK